jgi:transketolase C-terminal domain/subunit
MRREFKEILHKEMSNNKDIWLICPDLGFGFLDKIQQDFPDRFVKCKASEQLAMGIAVGLALNKKISIIYSITPFLLWTPASWIRNYLNYEKIPVKLCGGGRLWNYKTQGFSHYCGDDKDFLSILPNIDAFWPNNTGELEEMTNKWLYSPNPAYLNLKR